jgi:hypothetical protein
MDEDELLAQFERKSEQEKAAVTSADAEEYEAFSVKDRMQNSLYVRAVGEPYQWVTYRYLLQTLAAPSGSRLDLVFSFQLVTITGRNLLPIADAIAKGRCEFVQQFDAKHWPKPKDDSAPFVSSIKYKMSAPVNMAEE